MFTVSIKTVTLCSNVMSAMSVSKKSDLKVGCKIMYHSVHKLGDSIML